MRAISMKCPNCGAGLEAPETAHTVSCKYCGTQSRIQHRTRFLERKVELPPARPEQRSMPVAKQRHGVGWFVTFTALLPLIMGGTIFYVTMKRTGQLSRLGNAISNAAESVTGGGSKLLYSGFGNALLFDVNGDGHRDVISTVRYTDGNDQYHLAAFDGQDGTKLWSSEVFGTNVDATRGLTALHHDTVLQSDSRGNIAGFSATDGTRKFKVSLGEKLKELCANGESSIAVHLTDKRWRSMSTDTGTFTPLEERPDACADLPTGKEHGQIDTLYARDHHRSSLFPKKLKIEGMRVRETVALRNQPGRFVALGYKHPGTRIPMIAYLHDAALDEPEEDEDKQKRRRHHKKHHRPHYVIDWAKNLPALDPLGVKEGEPKLVAANSQCIASLYEPRKGPPHLVCFNPASGVREWDRQLPNRTTYVLRALDITDTRIFVGQWSELDAFNIEDGTHVFKVGL